MNGLIMKILRGSFLPLPPHYSSDLRALIGKLLAKARPHFHPPSLRRPLAASVASSAPQPLSKPRNARPRPPAPRRRRGGRT